MRSLLLLALLLAPPVCRAAEEAKDLLKVPPADDRPAHDAPVAARAPAAEAESTPSPSPETTPPVESPQSESAASDTIVPAPYPVSRYALLWENSPFQNESVAPPVESAGLSQRFVLGGILRENGEYQVWVRERATQQSFKIDKKTTNQAGLSLVEVAESRDRQSDASATVRLGSEVGVIKFDNTAVAGGAPAVPPPFVPQPPNASARPFPQGQRPAVPTQLQQPVQPGVVVPQAQASATGIPAAPAPGVVPPVPGPGAPTDGQIAPGEGQAMPPPRVIRRRAIVPAAP